MAKSQCKYCASGHKPNKDGDHWIVKSIVPAKIDIRKCKQLQPRESDNA